MPDIDHRFMRPPFLRAMHVCELDVGSVSVWDFRVSQPNVSYMSSSAIHSLEHFLSSGLRSHTDCVLLVAPMGCGTGFYVVTYGSCDIGQVAELLANELQLLIHAEEVPLSNIIDCGCAFNHSLNEAKSIASWLLKERDSWFEATDG